MTGNIKAFCDTCEKITLWVFGNYWMGHRPYGYTEGYKCEGCGVTCEDDELEPLKNSHIIKTRLGVK